MHQYRDMASFSPKSKREYYGKGKRVEEDQKDQKNRKDYEKDKINSVIARNSNSEVDVYHHIIYGYQQKLIVLR